MNRVILMGRLTRDPEIRYSQSDPTMAIASYTLAVDRRGKKSEDGNNADFIPCRAFGRAADFASKYLRKGMKILVSGRIQTGSYTNREGQKVYTTEVIIDDQEFAESKSQGTATAQAAQPQNRQERPSPIGDGFMEIPDSVDYEGLPFN